MNVQRFAYALMHAGCWLAMKAYGGLGIPKLRLLCTGLVGVLSVASVAIVGNAALPAGDARALDRTAVINSADASIPELVTGSSPKAEASPSGETLTAWVTSLSAKLDIPAVALRAYASAELRLAKSKPGCHLAWTTLAGLGGIESNHGRFGGSTLLPDGRTSRPIRGIPLDGTNGTKRIPSTDGGRLDGDTTYDRAMGPMQFIPTTWAQWGADGTGDGTADPDNIFDAALAAGEYLCTGGRDLSRPADWQNAVLSYNAVDIYLRDVFAKADEYGKASRQ